MIAIHQLLLIVARPRLLAPINAEKSLYEIIRVTKEEVAIMAMRGDYLVGTMGLIRPTWWYADDAFLTDRWNFCIESEMHNGAGKLLNDEAVAIARAAKLKFINQGKIRRLKEPNTFLMMPRVECEDDIFTPQGNA